MRRTALWLSLVAVSAISIGSGAARATEPAVPTERAVPAGPAAPIVRTVFVSVVDKDLQPVPGLTAADFEIKEGGQTREITSVALPTTRMRIALMVEESITADSSVRMGLFEFAKRVLPQGDISLITIGLKNTTLTPHTSDINAVVAALNGLSLRQNPLGEHLAEGIFEQAKVFQKQIPERPVMVVVGLETLQASAERPERVLSELRLSRATLYAVTLSVGQQIAKVGDMADLAERGMIVGEGTRLSGGQRFEATTTPGIPRALQRVASELLAQYQITYVLPEGVKMSDRLSVALKKKGPTLRAPSRITDK